MNKTELVAKLAEKSEVSKKDAEAVLNAFMETVGETLAEGDKITLVGFGTFEPRERAARVGRNPRNPEETIEIAAAVLPAFKASKKLKEIVNA